jgi:hypothetical protein
MTMNDEKLTQLLGKFVGDLGATLSAGGVVVGHRLGLYQALGRGAATPEQLAERTGCHPRYMTEWLGGQAAGGYIGYDPATGTFAMSEEQVYALTDPSGPVYLPGAFLLALGALRAEPRITEVFRTGAGLGWHEHHEDLFTGTELFFRPGYLANLMSSWIPALDGVEAKLTAGATVADIGCGLGSSTVLLAQAYPRTKVVGSDYHDVSIERARTRAIDGGVVTGQPSSWRRRRPSAEVAMISSRRSTVFTTWAIRLVQPATFARRWPQTARGWLSSRRPEIASRTTSTRSVGFSTQRRPSSVSPTVCRRRVATRSARRRVRLRSGR